MRFQDQKLEEGTAVYDIVNPMKIEERVNIVFLAKFQRGLVSCFGIVVKCLKCSKKMHDPQEPFLEIWNKIFLLFCVIAVSLDPLFLYIPVVNHDKKCFELDKNLGISATVLRSITDILCIIHIAFQFRTGFYDRSSPGSEDDVLVENSRETAKRYLTSCFVINILAIFPLPQVVLFVIIPKVKGSIDSKVLSWLIFVVFLQYLPRLYQIIPVYKKVARTSDLVSLTAWAKAACNLLLYMLASHIVGAFWYFFSIGRENACWQKACRNYTGCVRDSFFCDGNLGDNTFLNDFCPIMTPNTTLFDFGIFTDALQSGIVESTDFPGKLFRCFWWGLQNLSSLGQNLNTSNYIWEICFAVGISTSGLLLLVFLIGNMQTYLQSKNVRSEDMRLKGKEIEQWMSFHKLSGTLKKQIKDYQQYKWQETKGVDVENLLHNLPKQLRRNVKRELCLNLLNKVPKFVEMGEQTVKELCDCMKLVLYTERSQIVHGGDPIDEMLFITRGKLWAYPTGGEITEGFSAKHLIKGDYCGEELINWALTPRSKSKLPISTKTIKAVTNVEGFALVADDLKSVITKFLVAPNNLRLSQSSVIESFLATWAASSIQTTWRQHSRRRNPELFPVGAEFRLKVKPNSSLGTLHFSVSQPLSPESSLLIPPHQSPPPDSIAEEQ